MLGTDLKCYAVVYHPNYMSDLKVKVTDLRKDHVKDFGYSF